MLANVAKSACNRILSYSAPVASLQLRTLADAPGKPRKSPTFHDVDMVHNPSEEYIDEFMKAYGTKRLNFKRNDIDMWKENFGSRYNLIFFCPKGTKRVIQTTHFINYKAISPDIDTPHQYQGFTWVDEEFRGKNMMQLVGYEHAKEMRNVSDNCLGQCLPPAMNMFLKTHGDNKYEHVTYVSYYKPSEMRVPEELKFPGITVRSAKEVPDGDITKYDQSIFPYDREKYMLAHLRDPAGIGKVAYDDNGNVVGLGIVVIYPSGECALNPLYADDPKVAQAIFKSILQEIDLNDKKLLRFHIKSLDKFDYAYKWFEPFVKVPLHKEVMAYAVYTTHPAKVDYRRVFSNISVTTSYI